MQVGDEILRRYVFSNDDSTQAKSLAQLEMSKYDIDWTNYEFFKTESLANLKKEIPTLFSENFPGYFNDYSRFLVKGRSLYGPRMIGFILLAAFLIYSLVLILTEFNFVYLLGTIFIGLPCFLLLEFTLTQFEIPDSFVSPLRDN